MIQLKGNGLENFNLESIEQEGEWHQLQGSTLELMLVELSPDQWSSIVRQSTTRVFDKKSRQYVEQENTSKSRKLVYEKAIKDCKGLTPRVVHEALKLKWNAGVDEDKEVEFTSAEQMQAVLYAMGSKSSRLNRFVYHRVVPEPGEVGDEADAQEEESVRTSVTGS